MVRPSTVEAVIVQFSDAHIGKTIAGSGFIPQTTGHDIRVLEAFSAALGKFRLRRSITRALIHGGDASATGDRVELDLYLTLRDMGVVLHAQHGHPVRVPRFAAGFARLLDIPGNHDFWDGRILNPNLNHQARHSYWSSKHYWSTELLLDRFSVNLHGLCSTSGASRRQQLFAVGAFTPADLADVDQRMTLATQRAHARGLEPVHVLVTHHSPSVGSGFVHGLCSAARNQLQQLCAQHHVAALLTGHNHTHGVFHLQQLPPDVRASTALQKNAVGQNQCRQFWLHELTSRAGTLVWSASSWRYENRRFQQVGAKLAVCGLVLPHPPPGTPPPP